MTRWNLIEELKDGSIRYKNPFAETESWLTPGRRHRPFHTNHRRQWSSLNLQKPQNYCAFCPAHYFKTTPEKSRYKLVDQSWHLLDRPLPNQVFTDETPIRRIGNLYEIVSFEYWQKNYGYELSKQDSLHQQAYLEDEQGRDHIIALLEEKYKDRHESYLWRNDLTKLKQVSAFLFGGSHELIVPLRHYIDEAVDTSRLCSSGELTPEEHYYYFNLSIHSANEIYRNNPFVRFVCIYTNWLRDAGASFEHLHRQILGSDRESKEIVRGAKLAAVTPQIYQDYVAFLANENRLAVCSNSFAIAVVDIGRQFPSISVYSKSENMRPGEHGPDKVRDVSNIVHAIHAALGSQKSLNEEWYYSPPGSDMLLPWHVIIKWRNHRLAGIEGILNIYPNEFSPMDVRQLLVNKLIDLRANGRIAQMSIGDECEKNDSVLNYWR